MDAEGEGITQEDFCFSMWSITRGLHGVTSSSLFRGGSIIVGEVAIEASIAIEVTEMTVLVIFSAWLVAVGAFECLA